MTWERAGVWLALRITEKATVFYFLYVSLLAAVLPLASEARLRVWCVNLALGGLLVWVSQSRARSLRDWLPAVFILLAYKEMGWLAQPHTDIARETAWVHWDRVVLGDWGLTT